MNSGGVQALFHSFLGDAGDDPVTQKKRVGTVKLSGKSLLHGLVLLIFARVWRQQYNIM
jgi:hypothetical protein